jgi:short-subunit dehydrogenase
MSFMAALSPVVLITGASSGIGAALARRFAAHGHDLVLVALPEPQLAALAQEIAATGRNPPLVVPLDLTGINATGRLAQILAAHGVEPEIIVNSAGFGLFGPAAELDRNEQLAMIDLNVRVLTDLSLRFADSLARHCGGVLSVASVSSFVPVPSMAVYGATKAYVISLSEALHRELAPKGVRMTALCPGNVRTGFQPRAGIDGGRVRGFAFSSPEEVARQGYDGFMRGKRVVIPGFGNKLIALATRVLPRALFLPIIASHLKRVRRLPPVRPPTGAAVAAGAAPAESCP